MNICTSLEQSKKLIELGIDISTADMHHVLIDSDKEIYDIGLGNYIGILPHYPAWSLTALLELIMPKGTTPVYVDNMYQMVYDIKPYYITSKFDNPLDAAFEMIVWLKENGKI